MEGKVDGATGGVNFVGVEMSMWFVGVIAVGTEDLLGESNLQSETTHNKISFRFFTVTFLSSSFLIPSLLSATSSSFLQMLLNNPIQASGLSSVRKNM